MREATHAKKVTHRLPYVAPRHFADTASVSAGDGGAASGSAAGAAGMSQLFPEKARRIFCK